MGPPKTDADRLEVLAMKEVVAACWNVQKAPPRATALDLIFGAISAAPYQVLFLSVGFFSYLYVAGLAHGQDISSVYALIGLLCLVAIPVAIAWQRRRNRRWYDENALRAGYQPRTGILVDLIVRQGAAPTGVDRGMLWVEQGRLYFVGHYTSFGLTQSQVEKQFLNEPNIFSLSYPTTLELNAKTPVGPLSVCFEPIDPSSGSFTADRRSELRQTLNRWLGAKSDCEGQVPPLTLGPGQPFIPGAIVGLSWPIVAVALGISWLTSSSILSTILIVSATILPCSPGPFRDAYLLRWRAVRDLHRLRVLARHNEGSERHRPR